MEELRALKEQLGCEEDFQIAAGVFKMLADPSRIRIFWVLCHWEACVAELSSLTGMTSPAVSHHLQRLKAGGLIVSRREGKEVYYRASDAEQSRLLHLAIEKTMEISCPSHRDAPPAEGGPITPIFSVANDPREPLGAVRGCTAEQIYIARQVHDFMTENLARRCTIEDLSRRFHINPSTLKEVFKAVYGCSLAAHIRSHRMELAAKLLLETDRSIADISGAAGYTSQSKFAYEFRKIYSRTPSEYRKLHRHPGMAAKLTGGKTPTIPE